MGLKRLIAEHDWSRTALGPMADWPAACRHTVSLMLESPVPMVSFWGEQGNLLYNDAYAAICADRHPAILGVPLAHSWPEAADFNLNVQRTVMAGGVLVYQDQEFALERNGVVAPCWFDINYSPIRDERQAVIGVLAVVVETTSKVLARQYEERLRASEARYRQFAQSIPNQVWTTLADGSLDWANVRVYEYCGAVEGELDDYKWGSIIHPDDLPHTQARWSLSLQTGRPYENLFRLRAADGHYRWFMARAVAMRDAHGMIERWVGTNTDMHEQRLAAVSTEQALQQAQKMETVGQLTGGVAHDFNNLLQVISANLQMLGREVAGNAAAQRKIDNALQGVQRGAKLASYLLAFSRRQPLDPVVLAPGRLIAGMEDMLRRSLGESVAIECRVAEGLWNTLVDATQLENAILNLAVNARDAMQGDGRLCIELGNAVLSEQYAQEYPETLPGAYVQLRVSDNGCGMPPEVQAKAFEPFFSTKPEGKGSGLGLSMVYGFARQSGGHARIDSVPGQGTSITLYLPRSLAEPSQVDETRAGPVEGGSERVLVVEDDDSVRESTVGMLRELGYSVTQANDGTAALALLDSGLQVDLLFSDVVMPGPVRGVQLAQAVRKRWPQMAVLFTSGYNEEALTAGGRADSSVALLGKPFSKEQLARKVRKVLDERPAPQPARALTVLLADDEPGILSITTELLRHLGHTVHSASDGAQAVELLAQAPDVVITDLQMPRLSGEELSRAARQRYPGIGVVLATGYAESVTNPAVTVLKKPYGLEELVHAIDSAVRQGACH